MSDVPKRLEKAEKLYAKQKPDLAWAELQALAREYAEDDQLLDMIVELLQNFEQKARVVEMLGQRFERMARLRKLLAAQSLFDRLQAVQKQPGSRYLTLANLYETQKRAREAETLFRHAAAAFRAAGNAQQELQAWRQVLRLNPRDYSTCLEVAARAEAAGEREFAGLACAAAAEISNEDYRLLERALRLLPERKDLRLRYVKSLVAAGPMHAPAALRAAEPLSGEVEKDPQVAGLLAEAYLANGQGEPARVLIDARLEEAEPAWEERALRALRLLAREASPDAANFASRLERRVDTNDPAWRIALDAALADAHEHTLLLYLAGAFERTAQTPKKISALYQSFDLALAEQQYELASERLEGILTADAYDAAASDRLELLRGHIDEKRWSELEAKLGKQAPEAAEALPEDRAGGNGTSLDDLLLQAEIFLQYQLLAQARERAKTIARLYPGEEAGNERLAKLYDATGVASVGGKSRAAARSSAATAAAAPAPAPAAAPAATARAAEGAAGAPAGMAGLDISPLIRALHREATPRRVFMAAVNHFGQAWSADRCLAAQFNSGQPPSNVVEFCAPGVSNSDPAFVARLLTLIEAHIPPTPPRGLCLPRTNETPQIAQTLRRMGIETLVAQPLEEGGNVIGVMLLEFCGEERAWSARDREALASLADQMVMALANSRLRGLLRQLTELDDRTGMLRISSLLEVLVAECTRAQEQRAPLMALCLELIRPPISFQAPENRAWLERVAQKLTAYLRPNDAGASLRPNQFLFILPDTVVLNCAAVFQKLRAALADFVWPDGQPLVLAAGAAESASEPGLAAEDIATDVLDRALRALNLHRGAPQQPVRVVPASPLVAISAE